MSAVGYCFALLKGRGTLICFEKENQHCRCVKIIGEVISAFTDLREHLGRELRWGMDMMGVTDIVIRLAGHVTSLLELHSPSGSCLANRWPVVFLHKYRWQLVEHTCACTFFLNLLYLATSHKRSPCWLLWEQKEVTSSELRAIILMLSLVTLEHAASPTPWFNCTGHTF